jgi:hypothetical protein
MDADKDENDFFELLDVFYLITYTAWFLRD